MWVNLAWHIPWKPHNPHLYEPDGYAKLEKPLKYPHIPFVHLTADTQRECLEMGAAYGRQWLKDRELDEWQVHPHCEQT